MSDDYVVLFERTNEYHRFHSTGIFTNINKSMLTIDFFEESPAMMKKFIVDSKGESRSEYDGTHDIKNYVHATAIVSPDNLPLIIDSLQKLYERYIQSKSNLNGV